MNQLRQENFLKHQCGYMLTAMETYRPQNLNMYEKQEESDVLVENNKSLHLDQVF